MGRLFPYVTLDCVVLAACLPEFLVQPPPWLPLQYAVCQAAARLAFVVWTLVAGLSLAAASQPAARQPAARRCLVAAQPATPAQAAVRCGVCLRLHGVLLFVADNCMRVSASCARDTLVVSAYGVMCWSGQE